MNLFGSVSGKNSGGLYYNYKTHFSIVLMAAVDVGYKFIVVDVVHYRSNSDTGIFKHSHLGKKFLLNKLRLLQPLPGFPRLICYHTVSLEMRHTPFRGLDPSLPQRIERNKIGRRQTGL